MRGGGDWGELQAAADRHAVRHAPTAIRRSVEAVQAWIEARDSAFRLAPPRIDKDEHGPPMPPSAEYTAAQREADTLACTAYLRPETDAAVEWWNGRRRYPIDIKRLEQAAHREVARAEIRIWQRARDLDTVSGAAVAVSILDKVRAERAAEGPRPMAAAIREAGGLWDQLDGDARQYVLSTSPEELRPARGAALAYLDAMRAARQVKPAVVEAAAVVSEAGQDAPKQHAPADPAVRAAWQHTEAAAAALVAQPGWQDAVKFWDEYRAQRVPAAKATDTERLEKAARQHQARDQVVAWQKAQAAGDVVTAGMQASDILAQTEVERAAEKGAPRPYIIAVASAEVDWRELRRSVDGGAIAAAGEQAPALQAARDWLDARAAATRAQSEFAEAERLTFKEVAERPEVVEAWRGVDKAAAALVVQPVWQEAVAWWDVRRKKSTPTSTKPVEWAAARHLRRERDAAMQQTGAEDTAAERVAAWQRAVGAERLAWSYRLLQDMRMDYSLKSGAPTEQAILAAGGDVSTVMREAKHHEETAAAEQAAPRQESVLEQ